ncbi:hypothetical protein [Ralstonia phage RP13]|nr:hypothetical protein [Ralstonia phage RP13]BCG50294.1 hypothetical protein [Ralstonia phage RP13]
MNALQSALLKSGLAKVAAPIEQVDQTEKAMKALTAKKSTDERFAAMIEVMKTVVTFTESQPDLLLSDMVVVSSYDLFSNLRYEFGMSADGLIVSGDTTYMPMNTFQKLMLRARDEMGFPVEATVTRSTSEALYLHLNTNEKTREQQRTEIAESESTEEFLRK